jgi:hypothetical protein
MRAFRLVFLRFLVGKPEARYQQKGEHSVLFFKHVWGQTWRHSTQLKKASISSCIFVSCFGEKIGGENKLPCQTLEKNTMSC